MYLRGAGLERCSARPNLGGQHRGWEGRARETAGLRGSRPEHFSSMLYSLYPGTSFFRSLHHFFLLQEENSSMFKSRRNAANTKSLTPGNSLSPVLCAISRPGPLTMVLAPRSCQLLLPHHHPVPGLGSWEQLLEAWLLRVRGASEHHAQSQLPQSTAQPWHLGACALPKHCCTA